MPPTPSCSPPARGRPRRSGCVAPSSRSLPPPWRRWPSSMVSLTDGPAGCFEAIVGLRMRRGALMFGRNLLLILPAFAFAFAAQGCGDGAAGNRGTGGAGGAAGHVGTGGHATGGQGGSASGGAGGAATGGAGGAASGGTGGAASGGAGQAGGGQGGAGNNGGASGQGGSSGASGGAGQAGSSGTVDGGSDGGNTVCPTVDGGTTPPTENDSITFVPSVTVSTVAGGASATNLANPVGVVI